MLSASSAWPQRLWRGRQQMQQRKRRLSSASQVGLAAHFLRDPVPTAQQRHSQAQAFWHLCVCALHMLSAFVLCADCLAAFPVVCFCAAALEMNANILQQKRTDFERKEAASEVRSHAHLHRPAALCPPGF